MSHEETYQTWIEQSAMVAPKVKLAETHSTTMQRGLFATDMIYEGERIMFIPSTALIGQQTLQRWGTHILESHMECPDFSSGDNNYNSDGILISSLERWIVGMIEELRRSIHDESSAVFATAKNVDYQWCDDDAVALYLLSCRYILKEDEAKHNKNRNQGHSEWDSSRDTVANDPSNSLDQQDMVEVIPIVEAVQEVSSHERVVNMDVPKISIDEQFGRHDGGECEFKRTHSFLPHIRMLPDSFPSSPLEYSPEEMTRIEGTNCHGFAIRMLQQFETDHKQLIQVLSVYKHSPLRRMCCTRCKIAIDDECLCHVFCSKNVFELSAYKWALCNIYSRSTDFEWHDVDGTIKHRRVIAPLFDMMNHDFSSEISHAMDSNGNLSVFASESKSIQQGGEIFLNYGDFSNEKLLLVYGFCVPNNPFDSVRIYAPISSEDPLFPVKARILHSRCGIQDVNNPHALVVNDKESILPEGLLAVLRLIGVRSMDEILAISSQETEGVGMISVENETLALRALYQALHGMTRQLALNMISDENLRGASGTFPDLLIPRSPNQSIIKRQGSTTAMQEESPGKQRRDVNIHNAKLLCQSEYEILQVALSEISTRLTKLEELSQGYQ